MVLKEYRRSTTQVTSTTTHASPLPTTLWTTAPGLLSLRKVCQMVLELRWYTDCYPGIIPAMLPFGLVQMPMTFDLSSTWRTIWYTGKSTVVNLMRGKI